MVVVVNLGWICIHWNVPCNHWVNHELLCKPKCSRVKCEDICPGAKAWLKLASHVKLLYCFTSYPVCAGSAITCDVWHACAARCRAFEETRAGRGRAGKERTARAPQRPAAHQEPESHWTGSQGPASGRGTDIRLGTPHRANQTATERGFFTCLQSITAFSPGFTCIRPTPITTAGWGRAQGWDPESDLGLHQKEEQGGDGDLKKLQYMKSLFFYYLATKLGFW